ncbi:MAG: type IV toxin-antitoxin system AbiEi family antitoxin domain-containing protein [Acidimicrobiales bacterium]
MMHNRSYLSYYADMLFTMTFGRLSAIAEEQWGLVTRRQAERAGVSPATMTRLASNGVLDRVAHGVYRLAECDHLMWPHCARSIWPHLEEPSAHGVHLRQGGGEDPVVHGETVEGGALRADQEGARSRPALDSRAGEALRRAPSPGSRGAGLADPTAA